MKYEEIEAIFDKFFEFPEENRSIVTSVSAKLFAQHVATQVEERADRLQAELDALNEKYEIPLNRHFYRYEPPRELAVIESEIKALEADIVRLLGEVTALWRARLTAAAFRQPVFFWRKAMPLRIIACNNPPTPLHDAHQGGFLFWASATRASPLKTPPRCKHLRVPAGFLCPPFGQPEPAELDPLDIETRLEELAQLQDGWLDGKGRAPDRASLIRLAQAFDERFGADLPLPHLYPTPEGGVQAEWTLGAWEVSLEIALPGLAADYQAVHTATGETREQTLLLAAEDGSGWAALNEKIDKLNVLVGHPIREHGKSALRGLGTTIPVGGARKWYVGIDGVKRWADDQIACDK